MAAARRVSNSRSTPSVSAEQSTFLAIVRTATALSDGFEQMLKPFGLSTVQYNVLRILRGAGREGLCRNQIRDRLLTRMPDVTRLLDRMEEAGLLERERREDDRRHVETRLTRKGRELVDRLDPAVEAAHQRHLGHLSGAQLTQLTDLLSLAQRDT
jgi:DNA-binding MarR family transcriptional regulator